MMRLQQLRQYDQFIKENDSYMQLFHPEESCFFWRLVRQKWAQLVQNKPA